MSHLEDERSTNSLELANSLADTRNSLMRLFRWRNSGSSRNRVSNTTIQGSSTSRNNNHQQDHQTQAAVPDIEVNSASAGSGLGNFLNSSGGSLLLSDAIREARRTR